MDSKLNKTKMLIKGLINLLMIVGLASCATFDKSKNRLKTELSRVNTVDDETIAINGLINEYTAERFRKTITSKTRKVILNSPGGYTLPAIEIGNLIYDRGLDVEVVDLCGSACANFIFPAGRRKIINNDAIVAWHGSNSYLLYQDKQKNIIRTEGWLTSLNKEIDEENRFFKKIGVNGFICWFGMVYPYNTWYSYTLNKNDMEKFGIRGVEVRENYPYTDSALNNLKINIKYGYIKVNWTSLEASMLDIEKSR